jgi:hypothetical protein
MGLILLMMATISRPQIADARCSHDHETDLPRSLAVTGGSIHDLWRTVGVMMVTARPPLPGPADYWTFGLDSDEALVGSK